jgi:cysteine desulfurase
MKSLRTQALTLRDAGRIYFDHNATTPLAADLPQYIASILDNWGNPSSIHHGGRGPKTLLRDARQALATLVGCSSLEIVFTSGGAEANNLAIKGVFESFAKKWGADPVKWPRKRFLVSAVEHPSVTQTYKYLESKGAHVEKIPVSRGGEIDLEAFKKMLGEDVALVSVMFANNETGNIFPIKELTKLTRTVGALFHSDCVQALGKVEFNLRDLDVDYASFSSHKFYSLKGSGFLYVKKGAPVESLIHGGGQERHRRAGTENVLAIASLGFVARKHAVIVENFERTKQLRDCMEREVLERIDGVSVTGAEGPRLPTTSSFVIRNVDGESLLMNLDIEGVSVSTGAACSSGNPEPSPTLLAMGLTRFEAQASLRVSIGWSTTEEDVARFIVILEKVVGRLRSLRAEAFAEEARR